ncbi:MAG: hypothetical protein Q9193_004280 [Seirophora villosa]
MRVMAGGDKTQRCGRGEREKVRDDNNQEEEKKKAGVVTGADESVNAPTDTPTFVAPASAKNANNTTNPATTIRFTTTKHPIPTPTTATNPPSSHTRTRSADYQPRSSSSSARQQLKKATSVRALAHMGSLRAMRDAVWGRKAKEGGGWMGKGPEAGDGGERVVDVRVVV